MPAPAWIASTLAAFIGAWLTFDGTRAMAIGDYVTPGSGRFAGQLGPWSARFRALGLDPRSTPIKLLHVAVGVALLASVVLLLVNPRLGWRCLMVSCVCGLWYLPFGTLALLVSIILLAMPGTRAHAFV